MSKAKMAFRKVGRFNMNKKAVRKDRLFCALLGTRTLDPLIKSQLLYQLS